MSQHFKHLLQVLESYAILQRLLSIAFTCHFTSRGDIKLLQRFLALPSQFLGLCDNLCLKYDIVLFLLRSLHSLVQMLRIVILVMWWHRELIDGVLPVLVFSRSLMRPQSAFCNWPQALPLQAQTACLTSSSVDKHLSRGLCGSYNILLLQEAIFDQWVLHSARDLLMDARPCLSIEWWRISFGLHRSLWSSGSRSTQVTSPSLFIQVLQQGLQ